MITTNKLIKTGPDSTLRILWLDEENDEVFTMHIFAQGALPEIGKLSHLRKAIKQGKITEVTDDPWQQTEKESKINAKSKEIRDKAYKIVNYIASNEPDIYYRRTRGTLVKQATDHFGISKVMLYKYLRRYWQRGKNKNALLPDYDNSGGRGKPKTAGAKKLGRPRKNLNQVGQGINVTAEVKQTFKKAIKKYYLSDQSNSFKKVYDLLIKSSYGAEEQKIPTFTQFKYWLTKEGIIETRVTTNKKKEYQLTAQSKTNSKLKKQILEVKPKIKENRLVAEMEKPASLDVDKHIDFYINKGFEAKYQGQHDLAIKYFSAVVNLGSPIDLEIMLVFDIVGMFKEAGRYREAIDVLNSLSEKGSEIPDQIAKDINMNIESLEQMSKR